MSFFTNTNLERCPGKITGNPTHGLCEKVCIQAKKVFDACIKQTQEDGLSVIITDLTPSNPTYPLTFVSAKSTSTNATITNLTLTRLPDRPHFARVQATLTVPVEVIYTDANGIEGKGKSTVSFDEDIIMYVPEPSIIPFTVEAMVSLVSPDGVYSAENTFIISACVTIIMKIVMDVEILIPSYGYATLPQCQEYTHEVCSGFFDLPIFPSSQNNT